MITIRRAFARAKVANPPTTSDADEDKPAAYNKHVAGYIVKQYTGDGLLDVVKMLDGYLKIVELQSV